MWDWLNLDYFYYAVSGVVWFWYKVFGFLCGPTSFLTWTLATIALALTVRVALPGRVITASGRAIVRRREVRPQIREIVEKYGNNRQRMAVELQKIQRQYKLRPILAEAFPVIVALYMVLRGLTLLAFIHVLISFNRTGDWLFHGTHLSTEANRATANYVFSPTDVRNFLNANLHGAPLGTNMAQTTGLAAYAHYDHAAVVVVATSLVAVSTVAGSISAFWKYSRRDPSKRRPRTWRQVILINLTSAVLWLTCSPWLLVGYLIYSLTHFTVATATSPRMRRETTPTTTSQVAERAEEHEPRPLLPPTT